MHVKSDIFQHYCGFTQTEYTTQTLKPFFLTKQEEPQVGQSHFHSLPLIKVTTVFSYSIRRQMF